MVRVYNKHQFMDRRRYLRRNMTKPEIMLWSKLKCRRMHGERFRRQFGVDSYILDFYCPRLKLAIEVDGDTHYFSDAIEYDKARQEHIESYGVHFLRFTNHDVSTRLEGGSQGGMSHCPRRPAHFEGGIKGGCAATPAATSF